MQPETQLPLPVTKMIGLSRLPNNVSSNGQGLLPIPDAFIGDAGVTKIMTNNESMSIIVQREHRPVFHSFIRHAEL